MKSATSCALHGIEKQPKVAPSNQQAEYKDFAVARYYTIGQWQGMQDSVCIQAGYLEPDS